ncbi:unnamed protein product, partial [Cladocopium goreaui]
EVVLLQVNWQLNATNVRNGTSFAALQLGQTLWLSSEIGAELAKALVICSFSALALLFAYCLIRGLPQKALQDPKVKEGCPGSWVVYMGLVYAFLFFSTDQYLASLPQMGLDLGGSQWIMSASIQSVFAIKGVVGIGTAALSDRMGRRPVLLLCSFLLSLASFCCGCAGHVEWFLAARVLQALGMAVEPMVWAMTRDYFENPELHLPVPVAAGDRDCLDDHEPHGRFCGSNGGQRLDRAVWDLARLVLRGGSHLGCFDTLCLDGHEGKLSRCGGENSGEFPTNFGTAFHLPSVRPGLFRCSLHDIYWQYQLFGGDDFWPIPQGFLGNHAGVPSLHRSGPGSDELVTFQQCPNCKGHSGAIHLHWSCFFCVGELLLRFLVVVLGGILFPSHSANCRSGLSECAILCTT